jgi:hypothetical protein
LSAVRSGAALRTRPEWIVGRSIRYPGGTHGLKRQAKRRSLQHVVSFTPWAWEALAIEEAYPPFPQVTATATLKAVRAAAGIGDIEWHDVRRSFRSFCARTGIGRDGAEVALGHIINQTELDRAYQKHTFEAEAEQAFYRWQRHLQSLVEGDVGGVVVPIRAG